ncbi:MAG: branched-chain amino acid ABC transporter permease [Ancylobacter novellus]|uniref:Branched-chain amino acid ABC transporter permease n=1 Tax=Ancylobacter novellus TaxID=921 RepID=A0A2W5KJV9_ANCNO|nr:MAG: branched-chain amino acid ABC transporter permease [Ancylobacter novellus]
MEWSGQIFSWIYQYFDNMAFLMLAASGLILIYGMMGVINMAHGELMMIGAYVATAAFHAGAPAPVAVAAAGLAAALAGVVMERLVIRHFYNQLLSSLVVTWGLSLILSQGALLLLGPAIMNMPTPFGSFEVGGFSFGVYRMVLFAVAIGLIAAVWALFRFTSFGVAARAAMENPRMASALGVDTRRVYTTTFAIGSALGGIAGAMFAQTAAISPFFGQNYTPMAFITVVMGGGANAILGLIYASLYLAGVQTIAANVFNQYVGYVSIMAAALVGLLAMPSGISDFVQKRRARAMAR